MDKTMTTLPILNIEALRNVARALRESPDPTAFTMHTYIADDSPACGTPACCLGHYAARADLQNEFELYGRYIRLTRGRRWKDKPYDETECATVEFDDAPILDHFGITQAEAHTLFSTMGCGLAKTIEQAAQYIENYIKRGYRVS